MIIDANLPVTCVVPGSEKFFISKEYTKKFSEILDINDVTHWPEWNFKKEYRVYMWTEKGCGFISLKKNQITFKYLLKIANNRKYKFKYWIPPTEDVYRKVIVGLRKLKLQKLYDKSW